ncbi:MAG: MaoC family dehydratase [Chloroflexi bacterium]|nr:MaoC family dehydratase [Chloroflexota bacterium]MBV9595736.1 MaoC family dehydratase [Chloroflexota bacterium]
MARRYFEDFAEGLTVDIGTFTLSADEIVSFARQYDPQPMHVDPEAARASVYGGLIASGWHTVARYMRLLVDAVIGESASMGSPGVDSLRWFKPVRPDETLRGRFTVLESRPSNSRPDWGIVRSRGEVLNAADEVVMRLEAVNFLARRPPG